MCIKKRILREDIDSYSQVAGKVILERWWVTRLSRSHETLEKEVDESYFAEKVDRPGSGGDLHVTGEREG